MGVGVGVGVGVGSRAGSTLDTLGGASSSPVANATCDRILQRCSNDAFTRYSTTSLSMMTGRGPLAADWNAGGFGLIATRVALEAGGTGVAGRD
jgi:hypothetical protein